MAGPRRQVLQGKVEGICIDFSGEEITVKDTNITLNDLQKEIGWEELRRLKKIREIVLLI